MAPRDPGVKSQADGSFTLHISEGRIAVWCEGGDFAPGDARTELGATPATVTVRVVRYRKDGVDLGAEVAAEPDGARLLSVTKTAARAGLQVGDLVRAVDGVPLAKLARRSMQALAFSFPSSAKPHWTVVRAGATLEITVP